MINRILIIVISFVTVLISCKKDGDVEPSLEPSLGCCSEDSQEVINNLPDKETARPIVAFNVITPNGDGSNDVFAILGIEQYQDNNVKIFNRGKLVFETNQYGGNGIFFSGKNNSGIDLEPGTYSYKITIGDGDLYTASGNLCLVRSVSGGRGLSQCNPFDVIDPLIN